MLRRAGETKHRVGELGPEDPAGGPAAGIVTVLMCLLEGHDGTARTRTPTIDRGTCLRTSKSMRKGERLEVAPHRSLSEIFSRSSNVPRRYSSSLSSVGDVLSSVNAAFG
jgi:hypothetical protein